MTKQQNVGYQPRTYRNSIGRNHLKRFTVMVKETDLLLYASVNLEKKAREIVLEQRGYLEEYIRCNPLFVTSFAPWETAGPAPAIVREMAIAGQKTGVGPMAAVAGGIAEAVGKNLLKHADEIIVENGGDIFVRTNAPVTMGIFAGNSPLSMRVGLTIASADRPMAVCTSSGTIGHSMSMGVSDAVCVVADSCPLADAAATSIGNHVNSKTKIRDAIDFGNKISGIAGIIIIKNDRIGMWGDLDLVPFQGKKS
ncbi:MAG: UPF0280 family protein [Deltaproteobacteria bacterium]|nr:UPF0280 family protein [Deltaproteobacteria bacterium]